MEFVFLVLFLIATGVYLSDRKGWNATAKRLTTIARANLEAKKPIKTLEPVKDKDDWEQRFKAIENPPSAALVRAKKRKHEIVKRDYELALGRLWPRVTCKCGFSASTPDGIYTEKKTFELTAEKGDKHVSIMNKADELKESGNNFQW